MMVFNLKLETWNLKPETNFYLRHMSVPNTRIENFTSEEKRRLLSILRKRIFMKSTIYIFIILCSALVLVYFNFFKTEEFETLWLLNIAFIVTAFISVRICMGDFLEYLKEVRSPFKKIVITRVVKCEGNKITIGNQEFKKEDILLDASEFDGLRAGDNIRVEYSEKSHTLFSVKKI